MLMPHIKTAALHGWPLLKGNTIEYLIFLLWSTCWVSDRSIKAFMLPHVPSNNPDGDLVLTRVGLKIQHKKEMAQFKSFISEKEIEVARQIQQNEKAAPAIAPGHKGECLCGGVWRFQ
jgi:hypothetical protein